MRGWTEGLHLAENDMGEDQEPEDRGVQGVRSGDALMASGVFPLKLDDDETSQALDTLTALRNKRERLVEEMLATASEIQQVESAISQVAKVNIK
jgi:hypothetical protein